MTCLLLGSVQVGQATAGEAGMLDCILGMPDTMLAVALLSTYKTQAKA